MAPQAIGGEVKLVVNYIRYYLSGEPLFLFINDLGETSIVKQAFLMLDLKLRLSVPIQLVTTDNSSMCPICYPSLNSTNLQFQLCIFSGILNIQNLIEEQWTEPKPYSFLCLRIYFEWWTAGQLTHRWRTYRSTCQCLLTFVCFNGNFPNFFNHQVYVIG